MLISLGQNVLVFATKPIVGSGILTNRESLSKGIYVISLNEEKKQLLNNKTNQNEKKYINASALIYCDRLQWE